MEQSKHGGNAPDEDIRALYARLDDMSAAAERGELAMTAFLTPREAKYACARLSHRLSCGLAVCWGGSEEAERVRMILLPDYAEGMISQETLSADPAAALAGAGLEELSDALLAAVTALRIRGSGYRTLTHRDYLGSLMGAGLNRDAVGDVLVESDCSAVVICGERMAAYLADNLEKVGADTVKVSRLSAGERPQARRLTQPIQDTVASERLDCVVAALCNLSRDKAQTLIRGGLCELEYEPVQDCDRTVEPPAVLSVSGYGKFRIDTLGDRTRKGRLRLLAVRYI